VLADHDVSWVARYTRPDAIVLDAPKPGGDWSGCDSISHEETDRILARLLLAPLQFGSWGPGVSAARGHVLGSALRSCARQLGCPSAVHLWPDYEGPATMSAGAARGREALEALAQACCPDSEPLGLYHSLSHPLSGAQLYGLRGYSSYWGAAQASLPVPLPRGHAIRQRPMRAGYASREHPRWCGELARDCPVPAETYGTIPRCPIRPIHCLIPVGAPGHDPDILSADLHGDLPVLWAAR
jgi:hypothetical protein